MDFHVVLQLQEALHRTGAVANKIAPTDWGRPTPCTAWTVRDLLNHVVAVTTRFTNFAEGDDRPRMPPGDLLGDDPINTYGHTSERSASAWRNNSQALQRTCLLSFGHFDGRTAAAINAFDVMVHGWDLAQALGAAYDIPDDLALLGLEIAEMLVTPLALEDGHYAPPHTVSDSASLEQRLLARTGRSTSSRS